MFIKKSWSIIACCSITVFTHAMEQQGKPTYDEHYLATCGNEDAPSEVQEINNKILDLYKSKGYLNENTTVTVKYISNEILEKMRNDGCTTWNNMFTNGKNFIHIAPEHDKLTKEEMESKLAHENAHIALHQNPSINPHRLMQNIHCYGIMPFMAFSPCIFSISIALAAKSKRPFATFVGVNAATAGVIKANSYLNTHLDESYDSALNKIRVEYPFLHKLVEVECDIIAATALKDGGKHGESVYRKHLKHNGNTNGVNGDHPYTSTRIWYHHKIKQAQDCFKQKEKSEIK